MSPAVRHEQGNGPSDETSPLLSERQPVPQDEPVELVTAGGLSSECIIVCQQSFPLIVTYLLQYSSTVITTIVAGRLGSEELGAASIGLTTMNIIGLTFMEGMATALDTVCAQAYGSGNLTNVGLYVQRMAVLMTLVMIPIGSFWIASPWILPLVVKQHDIAVRAGLFLQVSLIGLPGFAFFEAGKRFLQAQGDFRTGAMVLFICAPVNVLLSWLFTIKFDMGLPGAALAQALANNLRPILLLLYIFFFGQWSFKCWGGWSRDAFRSWGHMWNLSMAGTALNMAEWLAFEILMVSTSYIGTTHLAAQTILNTLSLITWHIPFSISVVVSTRVGIFVGAGLLQSARRATALYAFIFVAVGIFDGMILFLLRNHLTSYFSFDPEVLRIATSSMLAVALFQVIDSIISGCNGVLRGLGCQSVAAWVVLAINYLGAVPFALWLELGPPDIKIDGLWYGLGSGMVVIAIVECTYMKWISWQDRVEDVRKRELVI